MSEAPRQSDSVRAILEEAIAARVFPGAVVWLERDDKVLCCAAGTTAYEEEISQPITLDTIYDIASLSKLVTLAAFLIAARQHRIAVTQRVAEFLPDFHTTDKCDITLRHLLNHTGGIGFPIQALAPRPSSKMDVHGIEPLPRHRWIEAIAKQPLSYQIGTKVLYSCTNYFLLARVISHIIRSDLTGFIIKQLWWPLHREQWEVPTTRPLKYFAPSDLNRVAPTEIDGDGTIYQGVVHDEAARVWWQRDEWSFCGNAGWFASIEALALLARLWINEGAHENRQILHPADVRNSIEDLVPEPVGPNTIWNRDTKRGWCWQIDAPLYMSRSAPSGSIGHTGFTGPTLWLHPATRRLCIVLNNRTFPTRNGPDRMPFHRRIAELLDN
jgi:CubicO group peptidase (beta-lactamase class C family)